MRRFAISIAPIIIALTVGAICWNRPHSVDLSSDVERPKHYFKPSKPILPGANSFDIGYVYAGSDIAVEIMLPLQSPLDHISINASCDCVQSKVLEGYDEDVLVALQISTSMDIGSRNLVVFVESPAWSVPYEFRITYFI